MKSPFAIFCLLLVCSTTYSSSFVKDSLIYSYIDCDSVVTMSGVSSRDVDKLVIPSEVDYDGRLYKVYYISSDAFSGCSKLSEITIPCSIKELDLDLFRDCPALSGIHVCLDRPNSISFIYTHNDKHGYDWIRHMVNVNLFVPEGSIENYIHAGYPWIGFKSISDGTRNISVQSFVSKEGDIFNISDHNRKEVYGVFREREGSFVVPEKVVSENDGQPYSVVGIGTRAFFGDDRLVDVFLPNTIKEIGSQAFEDCNNLVSLRMSDSLSVISHDAFYNCEKLIIDSLPEKLIYIGNSAFEGCRGLSRITLNQGLSFMGRACFRNCGDLESVTIPYSVREMGLYSFYGCNKLTNVYVTWDEVGSFPPNFNLSFEISSMTVLHVPVGVDNLWPEEEYTSKLSSFRLVTDGNNSSGIRSILADSIIYVVKDIRNREVSVIKFLSPNKKIVIPDKVVSDSLTYYVTGVEGNIHSSCDSLIVSEGITDMNCSLRSSNLKYLYLPSSLKTINVLYPSSLSDIGPEGSGCDVEYGWIDMIPDAAFKGMLALKTVVISSDIKLIGIDAFDWCGQLNSMKFCCEFPPTIMGNTLNISDLVLYVPKGSKARYKKDPDWKKARKIKVMHE